MESQIVVNDYHQMDRILKEERQYILDMCKKIKKTGCNVILIQKSILRDAVNELSLHFLSKLKIMVVKDIERDEVEFICKVLKILLLLLKKNIFNQKIKIKKSLGCTPIADIETFTEDRLGYADLVEEVNQHGSSVVKVTGVKNPGKTVSIVVYGANQVVVEEAERSLHDALCVIRCLVKKRALIAGGGAPEIHVSQSLAAHAKTLSGITAYCLMAFADSLEVFIIYLFLIIFLKKTNSLFFFFFFVFFFENIIDYSIYTRRKCWT